MHIASKFSPRHLSRLLLKWRMITTIFLLCFTLFSKANEQVQEAEYVNNASNPNSPIVKDDFDWQIMIDLSVAYTPVVLKSAEQTDFWHYFQPGLLVDISYKGFFLQTNQRRSATVLGGAEIGYQLLVKEDWQIDIIAKGYLSGYTPSNLIENYDADDALYSGLSERNDTGGIALRYSRYFDNAIFTIDVAAAHAESDITGLIVDSFYSYLLPYRNWDIYFGAGLTYYDQDLVDYYIGINPDEVTPNRTLYTADDGFRGQLEIYAQYPLSASWSFNAGITQSFYENKIKHSPLIDKNKLTQVMLGVLYVF